MAQTKLGELVVNTTGSLPPVGSSAPDFQLTSNDLKDVSLKTFSGKNVVLNIFPSIDTGVCATSVREFKDLPFAMKRFCGAEGIDKVITLSDFRSRGFTKSYGIEMTDGALAGLMARCVVVVGGDGKVKYHELVPAIGQEPNYDAALAAI
jgi:thiol peroxidase